MECSELIGVSRDIERIRELIKHLAETQLNVLITGETGVGKEVVAQNLYSNSSRAGNFVKVNCAALPEGLLESELYGYERGAFTGAERRKKGKFELANRGVLFLDEIGDMPLFLQSKILHVLQSGEYSPLGAENDVTTDSWVISATNHNLADQIKQKIFREDLYYRLSIIKICIPPLRNRPEDIRSLIDYFLKKYQPNVKTPALNSKLSVACEEKLLSYHWPGNIRELQNVVRRFILFGEWDQIIDELSWTEGHETFNPSNLDENPLPLSDTFNPDKRMWENNGIVSLKKIKKQALDKLEKEVICFVLNNTGWNRSKASKILKISYKTLLYKIEGLQLSQPNSKQSVGGGLKRLDSPTVELNSEPNYHTFTRPLGGGERPRGRVRQSEPAEWEGHNQPYPGSDFQEPFAAHENEPRFAQKN